MEWRNKVRAGVSSTERTSTTLRQTDSWSGFYSLIRCEMEAFNITMMMENRDPWHFEFFMEICNLFSLQSDIVMCPGHVLTSTIGEILYICISK